MKKGKNCFFVGLLLAIILVVWTTSANAKQEWVLINPEGPTVIKPFKNAPRLNTLEGKTVLLHWNAKHNGDIFLNRVADLLTNKVKDIKIIKAWEVEPKILPLARDITESDKIIEALAKYKFDIVIGAQCD
jgi:hypothetical protein